MLRFLTYLLIAFVAVPSLARAEEAERPARVQPVDPAQVGRLLISEQEAERARGARLLLERIAAGGPLEAFLARMAEAQAEWANAHERLVATWVEQAQTGTDEERKRARRLLFAAGPEATERLLRAVAVLKTADAKPPAVQEEDAVDVPAAPSGAAAPPPPPAAEPPPQVAQPAAAASPWRADYGLSTTVLLVPRREVRSWADASAARQYAGPHAADLALLLGGEVVVRKAEAGRGLLSLFRGLPDTRVAATESRVPSRENVLLDHARVRYRRDVRQTPKGAWRVDTDTVPRGLEVRLQIDAGPGADHGFDISARNVEVPTPLAVTHELPQPGVEPVELDRPEWRVASAHAKVQVAPADTHVVALFPDVVDDWVVVVDVERTRTKAK